MNTLIIDFRFTQYHKRINCRTVNFINTFSNIVLASFDNYYSNFKDRDSIEIVNVKCKNKRTNKLFVRFQMLYNILDTYIKTRCFLNRIDIIYILGFESITIPLVLLLYGKSKPIYLQYHQQIDSIEIGIKKSLINSYKDKVHHIFLEERFMDYFQSVFQANPHNVHVVHHPLYTDEVVFDRKVLKYNRNVLGISSGNDEKIISKLCTKEVIKYLRDRKVNMTLRSANTFIDEDGIVVNNEFLPADKYKGLFCDAKLILIIPEATNFKHRVSGSIYDAVAAGKMVLGVDILIMRIMHEVAPSMFNIIDPTEPIENQIMDCLSKEIRQEDLESAQKRCSDEIIIDEYKKAFCS